MELALLGPFDVVGPHGRVVIGSAKERLLLALLAVRPNQVVSADDVIDGLWGDDPPPSAPKTMQGYVARLRRILEKAALPGVLVTRDPGYLLAVDPVSIDAVRFERHTQAGREALAAGNPQRAGEELRAALALWRGPQALADCVQHDALRAEATRLEELRLAALEDRIDADLACGEHAGLVGELEALVAREALRERLWHALVLALYRAGRQGDALRAYQRARTTLVEELGVEPGPDLQRLEQAVLERDPALDLRPVVAAAPVSERDVRPPGSRLLSVVTGGPAFVGRERELDVLSRAWERSVSAGRQAVFIGGEPGIGKTRLAAEVATIAQERGAFVLHGRCDEGLGVPYQPFVEALRDFTDAFDDAALAPSLGHYANELVRLVPELADRALGLAPPMQSDPATEQYRLFDAVTAWLSTASLTTPLVLVLDDLHWAAQPTLLLLRHVLTAERPAHFLVVGTYRSSEIGERHRLRQLLADMWRVHDVTRVDLDGLDAGAVAEFVEAIAGQDLDEAGEQFARAVHAHTAGNPFFVHEVLRNAFESSEADEEGITDLTGHALAIPAGVREVVTRRVARLSGTAQEALTLAAVVGPEFETEVLQRLTDVDVDALLGALEEASAARLVDELEPNRFCFAHALVRGALYDELSASRRLRLHRQVGAAIESVHAANLGDHLAELAYHYSEADPERAVGYAADAAQHALDGLAFENAVTLCQRGLDAAERARNAGTPIDMHDVCGLYLTMGRAELRAGQPRGRTTLLRAFDIARTIGDTHRQAAAVLAVNRGFFARIGRTDRELVASLEDAIAAQPDRESPAVAELLATLASELVWAADGERRFALSDEAVALARRTGDRHTLARVLLLRTMTILAPDTLNERVALYDELEHIADELGDPAVKFDVVFAHSGTSLEAGDMDLTNRMEETASALAKDLRQPRLVWQASFMRTARYILEGKLVDAERTAIETLALGQRAGQEAEAFIFFTEQMLEIRRWQGRLHEMLSDFRDFAGNDSIDFGYSLTRYLFDAGERDTAAALYADIMGRVDIPPRRDMLASATLYNLAYLAANLDDTRHGHAIYEALLPYAGAFASTTVGKPIGDHFLGVLAGSLGDVNAAIDHLERALDAQTRLGAPLLLAETTLELARVLGRSGRDPARAARLLASVREIASVLGAGFLAVGCDQVDLAR